jgi:hypothetical protein
MKTKFLFLAVAVAAFSSCSTIYKSGQTPDDVYYSPARTYNEVQKVDKDEVSNDQVNNYNNEDRLIRMGITDSRWRNLDYDYSYTPYNYSFYNNPAYYGNYYRSNYYNPYYSHFYYNDYYYNPYYNPYPVYVTPVSLIKNTTPRITNLNGYGRNYNNVNAPLRSIPATKPSRDYNNSNRQSGLGNILNKVFSPSNNNNNNNNNYNNSTNNTTQRTYTPPPASNNTSSSSGSSSSGSSGSRITRPN